MACNKEVVVMLAAVPIDGFHTNQILSCAWCSSKVKLNPDNNIQCYRSRIFAKGYLQKPCYNYTEVFAPTFHPVSLCFIIALAAKESFQMWSLDISSVFTYGELDEVIYIKQPKLYHQGGPNVIYKLHKLLYGLK